MANKKITDVDVVSTVSDADYLFVNQGQSIKQIKKSDIPKPTYTAEEVGALPNTTIIPTTLPNPNALTFTGAATGSYDGSSPVEINIPEGGGTDVTVDNTLSVAGKAADAKATGDAISSLSEEMKNKTGTGLSTEAIDKLEEVGNYLAYTTADGGSKWTELIAILRNGSSGSGSGETVPATGISLDKTTLSFTDSATQTLVATVEPSDTTDKVVWTSNAESVATVTNGVVKPLSNGSATITATCGSVSATCFVTVDIAEEEQVTLTSISATYTGGDVAVGTSLNDLTGITVTATYSDGSTSNVIGYTLSGEIVEGSNTITVSYGGKSTTFTVTGVAESGGNDSSEELMSESNIVATGYTIAKNVQYSFYQLTVKEDVNVYEIPVESGVTYEATITNNYQYGTPYWDNNTMKNVNAISTFAISADKFTDFSTTDRVTVTLDGNTTIDTNMTTTPNGDGTYTRRITFTPVISGYLYTDNRTSTSGNIYSIKKVVA